MPDLPSQPPLEPRPRPVSPWRAWITAERRRAASYLTRENVLSGLQTMAWVVPLTLLIWIYAEREQIDPGEATPVPFRLTSADPKLSVALKSSQDSNLMITVSGPRATVQAVLKQLRGGNSPEGLVIQIDKSDIPSLGENPLQTLALIEKNPVFRGNGLTVKQVIPQVLPVVVDEVVDRQLRVTAGPDAQARLDPTTTFEPAFVSATGPKSIFTRAEDALHLKGEALREQARRKGDDPNAIADPPLSAYVDIPESLLNVPGTRQQLPLPIVRPPELADPRLGVDPPRVNVSLNVRAADADWVVNSMPVWLIIESGSADGYKVEPRPASLKNVRLIGPPDVIDKVRRPDFGPRPVAAIDVSADDLRSPKPKTPRYLNLPAGVRASDEDLQRTVEYDVTPRTRPE